MSEATIYQAPQKSLEQEQTTQHQRIRLFAIHQRIGRLRYFAFNLLALIAVNILSLLIVPVFVLLFSLLEALIPETNLTMSVVIAAIGYILAILLSMIPFVILAMRRLHDINQSGWWSLLITIPIINLIVWLWLQVAPGYNSANTYGAPPEPNGISVKAASLIGGVLAGLAALGIVAAIALPAYQDYVKRSQEAASGIPSESDEYNGLLEQLEPLESEQSEQLAQPDDAEED